MTLNPHAPGPRALTLRYAYLVPVTRERCAGRLPARLDPQDLDGAGYLALCQAAHRFDPRRKTDFKTYAIATIRGAMLEYLRREDWVPRKVRARERAAQRRGEEFPLVRTCSLEELLEAADLTLADTVAGPERTEEPALHRLTAARIAAALGELPPRQREIVRRHFWQDQSYRAIAAAVGRAESTVCLDLARARVALRRALVDLEEAA